MGPASRTPQPSLPKPINYESLLGDSPAGIFTFIQVSDIHISRYIPHGGLAHFASFLALELPAIAPDLLLLSGDLINAEIPSKMSSQQYSDEWIAYESLLNQSKIAVRSNGSFFFDQRGNHDCFNTDGSEFRRFSKVKADQGYVHRHEKSFGSYTFAALDACPHMGTSRPINFFGILDQGDMDLLADVVSDSVAAKRNHTFVATHYPTSTMIMGTSQDGKTFSELAQHVSLWVSGHLHKLIGGKVSMYGFHDSLQLLEMELGDMKDNAAYRLVAVDNDMLAISDEVLSLPQIPAPVTHDIIASPPPFPLPGWKPTLRAPLILVTNPRDARFASPAHEPIHRVLSSTHIRFLVYSFSGAGSIIASKIEIKMDGRVHESSIEYTGTTSPWSNITHLNETANHVPLYVSSWDAQVFNDGRDHELHILVIDENGLRATKTIIFRVDGLRAKTHGMSSGIGGYVIAASFEKLFKGLFLFAHLFIAALLHIPKFYVDFAAEEGSYSTRRSQWTQRLQHLNSVTAQSFFNTISSTTPSLEAGTHESTQSVGGYIGALFERLAVLWTIRLMNLAHTPKLYYPYFIYFNYLIVGPWFVGNLVPNASRAEDRIGFCYIYGLWFAGGHGWVPLLDTWYIALWEHTAFIFPLLLLLAFISPPPPRTTVSTRRMSDSNGPLASLRKLMTDQVLPATMLTLWFLLTTFFSFYGWTYGWFSVVLNPGRMWMTAWAVWALIGRRLSRFSRMLAGLGLRRHRMGLDFEEDGVPVNLDYGDDDDAAFIGMRRRG